MNARTAASGDPDGTDNGAARRTIRVLIADDQDLVRVALAMLIDGQPDLSVVGQAGDGQHAVMLARDLAPDVVLMDVRMPIMDGITATRRIVAGQTTHPQVIILTTYDLDEYVYDALRAGACGFLLKHAAPEELIIGVRAAADGNALISPIVTRRLIAAFTTARPAPAHPPADLARLTDREKEVFHLAVRGMSNTEIATALFIAETTVKTHLGHALVKLKLRDRVHAVVYAYETGIVSPRDGSTPQPGAGVLPAAAGRTRRAGDDRRTAGPASGDSGTGDARSVDHA